MLRAGFLFCSLIVGLLAMALYHVTPTFPNEMERVTFDLKLGFGLLTGAIKLFIMAENYGIVADSSSSFRNTIGEVRVNESEHPDILVERTSIVGVPVVIFRSPKAVNDDDKQAKHGALVYFHGGAFILGNPDTHFLWTKRLALETNATVISVDYRLAPEHPFPAAIEDCLKVTKAVFDEADKYGIDATRIMVGGDSAGGNLAGVVAIELAGAEKYSLQSQLLISPVLQAVNVATIPSYKSYAPLLPLPTAWFVAKYAGLPFTDEIHSAILSGRHLKPSDKAQVEKFVSVKNVGDDVKRFFSPDNSDKPQTTTTTAAADDKTLPSQSVENVLAKYRELALNERAWPLLTSDDEKLLQMCPIFITIAEFDPLADEGVMYFDRLRAIGAQVSFAYLKGVTHVSPAGAVMMDRPLSEKEEKKYLPLIVKYIKRSVAS